MDPDKAVVLQTFLNQVSVDLAAAALKARDIECLILTDDGGGMMLPLSAFKMLVNPEDVPLAREILSREGLLPSQENAGAGPSAAATLESKPTPPWAWVLAGMALGASLVLAYQRVNNMRSKSCETDINGDGRADDIQTFQRGELVRWAQDRNFDGSLDFWVYYDRGQITRLESDDNFDGRVDAWSSFLLNVIEYGQEDTDFNGKFDVFHTYKNGVLASSEWRPNQTRVVTLKRVYQNGVLAEEWRDLDRDGQFDVNVKFDAFQSPLQTNQLNLLSLPTQ